jgi:curved DNA-binding protein CbpA
MKTLYDLLGALPKDDAEELRTAFRRAAKGAHPDLHPGDPDAALRFREIVRANEILGDAEQREVYDHLLDLAQLEQVAASEQAVAARIHKFTSGIMALAGISVMAAGSYLLFMQMSAASLAPTNKTAPIMLASAALGPPPVTTANGAAMARDKTPGIPGKTAEPGGAIANLTQASLPDPRFSPADRGVIFYRPRNFDRAFADFSPAKPVEKPRRARSASGPAAPMRLAPAAASERPLVPVPRQRPLEQDPSRQESLAFVRLR